MPWAWLLAGALGRVREAGPVTRGVGARTPVRGVYPSGAVIPERLLRISIRFARPPGGSVRDVVTLHTPDGGPLGAARLTDALLPDALWSPDGTLLTLLFRPGRVKTGLRSHDQRGWALVPGETVTLAVAGHVVKRWRVATGGCGPLDPGAWVLLRAPRARTREPLLVRLAAPVDIHATDLIAIADARGARLAGRAHLTDGERTWRFSPGGAWQPGAYVLRVHPRAETPCGDEAGEAFEHLATDAAGATAPNDRLLARPFAVRAAP